MTMPRTNDPCIPCSVMEKDAQNKVKSSATKDAAQAYERLTKSWNRYSPKGIDNDETRAAQPAVTQTDRERSLDKVTGSLESPHSSEKIKAVQIDDLIQRLKYLYKPYIKEGDMAKCLEKARSRTSQCKKEHTKVLRRGKENSKAKILEKNNKQINQVGTEAGNNYRKEYFTGRHERKIIRTKFCKKECTKENKRSYCCKYVKGWHTTQDHSLHSLCSRCKTCSCQDAGVDQKDEKIQERDMFADNSAYPVSATNTSKMDEDKLIEINLKTIDSRTLADTEINKVPDQSSLVGKKHCFTKQKVPDKKPKLRLNGVRKQHRRRDATNYKVDISINNQTVTVTTDTGAEINVLPHNIAKTLKLPLQTSQLKISPYGAKPFKVIGKYVGLTSFGNRVTRSKWYIVNKKDIEPLLSGPTAEKLGIIKFTSKPVPKSGPKATRYIRRLERAFNGLGKLKGYDVKFYVKDENNNIPHKVKESEEVKKPSKSEMKWIEVTDKIGEEQKPKTSSTPKVVSTAKLNRDIEIIVDMRHPSKITTKTNLSKKDVPAETSSSCKVAHEYIYDVN